LEGGNCKKETVEWWNANKEGDKMQRGGESAQKTLKENVERGCWGGLVGLTVKSINGVGKECFPDFFWTPLFE